MKNKTCEQLFRHIYVNYNHLTKISIGHTFIDIDNTFVFDISFRISALLHDCSGKVDWRVRSDLSNKPVQHYYRCVSEK